MKSGLVQVYSLVLSWSQTKSQGSIVFWCRWIQKNSGFLTASYLGGYVAGTSNGQPEFSIVYRTQMISRFAKVKTSVHWWLRYGMPVMHSAKGCCWKLLRWLCQVQRSLPPWQNFVPPKFSEKWVVDRYGHFVSLASWEHLQNWLHSKRIWRDSAILSMRRWVTGIDTCGRAPLNRCFNRAAIKSQVVALGSMEFQILMYIILVHMDIYIRTYVHTYIPTYLPTYIRTYLHTYLHTYIPTYLRTYVPTYLRTYVPTYLRTYVRCTYIHAYIHTSIHDNIESYHILLTSTLLLNILAQQFALSPPYGTSWHQDSESKQCSFFPRCGGSPVIGASPYDRVAKMEKSCQSQWIVG